MFAKDHHESHLALRNTLATARDFELLDALETFDSGDLNDGWTHDADWPDAPIATARDVFGFCAR